MKDRTNMTPEERFTKIENLLAAMTEHQARHDEDIRQIHETQKASAQILRTTAELLLTLTGAQKATEQRLNALQADLDRLMRGPEPGPA